MSWLHWFDNTALVGFYALALVAIIASLRVITLANPVHAILSLIVSLLSLAGIFFILGAPFAGALQVIVYAGAILVLFVFVIMMLNLGAKNYAQESQWLTSKAWAVPAGLTFIIALVIYAMIGLSGADHGTMATATHVKPAALIGVGTVSAKQVGISLFSEYLFLVEVAAMLLLAALVAAYHLGKKALDDENVSHTQAGKGLSNDQFQQSDNSYDYQSVDANDFTNSNNMTNLNNKPHKAATHRDKTFVKEDR